MDTNSTMPMVFTSAHSTPLWSSGWMPTTTGGYAATCLFLVILSIISRLLLTGRHMLELKWHDRAVRRRYILVAGEPTTESEKLAARASHEATLTVRGAEGKVRVVRQPRKTMESAPWRISTDLPRACLFAIQAGVGYLLYVSILLRAPVREFLF